jgi:hypothetical protein
MISLNVNSHIKVKLTKYGIEAYERYIHSIYKNLPLSLVDRFSIVRIDEDGYAKFQLWEFMNIFGEYFYMGNTHQVIEPLEIYIEDQKEVS